MKELQKLILILSLILLHSCSNYSKFDKQIKLDLSGMLQNKVDVEEVLVTKITDFDANTQKVTFDCKLHFTDDLFKENGSLAFKKGMKVTEKNNTFYYVTNGTQIRLIKLEFGEVEKVTAYSTDILNQEK